MPIAHAIIRQRFTCPAKQIQQPELAALLEQPARLAWSVEIDPVLSESLQGGKRRETAVDRDFRRLLPREAAPEEQQAILARRQLEFAEHRVDSGRIGKIQTRLHIDRRRALADDRLVRPLARQEAQCPEQDTLPGTRFARHRREPCLEVERDVLQQGQVSDLKRLQHATSTGTKNPAAIKRRIEKRAKYQ